MDKTKEEKFREKIEKIYEDIKKKCERSGKICRDEAEKIADALHSEGEENIKQRNKNYIQYRYWGSRQQILAEIKEEIERALE